MLFRKEVLAGVREGRINLAFRRWKRPTVREGGTLRTAAGELDIGRIRKISVADVTGADARRAGYASRDALLAELGRRPDGDVYRIELGRLRADRRVALRATPARDAGELADLRTRLDRLDARAAGGPWTRRVLELIRGNPGVRAGDLCERAGQEKQAFKTNVRKLKNLGLTESLEVGYRLSPRGEAYLRS